jgi:hypothetical protein
VKNLYKTGWKIDQKLPPDMGRSKAISCPSVSRKERSTCFPQRPPHRYLDGKPYQDNDETDSLERLQLYSFPPD